MAAGSQPADTVPKRDDDSPWKEALERFFPEFLAPVSPGALGLWDRFSLPDGQTA
jgi:hypothetical protein